MKLLYILIVLALGWFLWSKVSKIFKFPKVGSFALVTGAVKSGKTTFTVSLCLRQYRRVHRAWKIRKFFQKLFRLPVSEEPLLYSNIPLSVPYVPLTKGIIEREERVNAKSVVLISEASLLADNSLYKDDYFTERIMLFCKLFGHMSHGGLCIYDTQAIGDLPAVTRRCLSQYFYVHHITRWIPFFLVAHVREDRYCEDGSVVSSYQEDAEQTMQRVIIPKSVWKKFDCYCYSCFTDDKPSVTNVINLAKGESLKAEEIISFKEYSSICVKRQ